MTEPIRKVRAAEVTCLICGAALKPSGNCQLDCAVFLTRRWDCPRCPVYSEWRKEGA